MSVRHGGGASAGLNAGFMLQRMMYYAYQAQDDLIDPFRVFARSALDVLEGHNYLRKIPSRRRDSEAWMVNPLEVRTWTTGQQGVA